jgi:beta-galactosidase
MRFAVEGRQFVIDGKPDFLLMGELHYFRMDPAVWAERLEQLKASGCNAVAFYVPWRIHEPEDGVYDFTGSLDPRNNLVRWMELVAASGLMAFVRPGPLVYSEMVAEGAPNWVYQNYPEVLKQMWNGKEFTSEGIRTMCAYLHPKWLELTRRWYNRVLPVIAPHMQSKGGPVVLAQICNETPHAFGKLGFEQHPEEFGFGREDGLWATYLREKYGTIEQVNARLGTSWPSFAEAGPLWVSESPQAPGLARPEGAAQEAQDAEAWEFFHTCYLPLYFRTLTGYMRENGIDCTIVHNSYNPKQVWGHAEPARRNPGLLIGVDSYYSLYGQLDAKGLNYFCEMGSESLRANHPVPEFVVEFESGYWNDEPWVYGPQMYAWTLWTFAWGMKGINMYMFAGGENRRGLGFFGTSHGWQAPVQPDGTLAEHYGYIQKALAEVKEQRWLLDSEIEYDLTLGVENRPGCFDSGLLSKAQQASFHFFRANLAANWVDLLTADLTGRPVVWAVSDGKMSREVQEKLLAYARQGGSLVLQGPMPDRNYDGAPCTVLKDALGLQLGEYSPYVAFTGPHCGKVVIGGQEFWTAGDVQAIEGDGEVVAETPEGKPAIVRVKAGRGSITWMPMHIPFNLYSQVEICRAVLSGVGVSAHVASMKHRAIVRRLPGGSRKLIALNYHPIPLKEPITVDGRTITVETAPYSWAVVDL